MQWPAWTTCDIYEDQLVYINAEPALQVQCSISESLHDSNNMCCYYYKQKKLKVEKTWCSGESKKPWHLENRADVPSDQLTSSVFSFLLMCSLAQLSWVIQNLQNLHYSVRHLIHSKLFVVGYKLYPVVFCGNLKCNLTLGWGRAEQFWVGLLRSN